MQVAVREEAVRELSLIQLVQRRMVVYFVIGTKLVLSAITGPQLGLPSLSHLTIRVTEI